MPCMIMICPMLQQVPGSSLILFMRVSEAIPVGSGIFILNTAFLPEDTGMNLPLSFINCIFSYHFGGGCFFSPRLIYAALSRALHSTLGFIDVFDFLSFSCFRAAGTIHSNRLYRCLVILSINLIACGVSFFVPTNCYRCIHNIIVASC